MEVVVWRVIRLTSVVPWYLVRSLQNVNERYGIWKRNHKLPVLLQRRLEALVRTWTSLRERRWRTRALDQAIKCRDVRTAPATASVWMDTNGEIWCWGISCPCRWGCVLV